MLGGVYTETPHRAAKDAPGTENNPRTIRGDGTWVVGGRGLRVGGENLGRYKEGLVFIPWWVCDIRRSSALAVRPEDGGPFGCDEGAPRIPLQAG